MSLAASIYERRVTPEEAARWLARPLTPEEVADAADLVAWFTRRYPSAKDRLAYVRRAARRWSAQAGG